MKNSNQHGVTFRKFFRSGRGIRGANSRMAAGLFFALSACAMAVEFPQGMLLHFDFDESSVSYIADRTGRGNDGRGTGCTWASPGRRGAACEFAATNSNITVTNRPALNLKQAAFTAWFKTSKSEAYARYICEKNPANGFALGVAGDSTTPQAKGKVFFAVNGHTCIGDSNVTEGVWHHAAAVYDGENLKLYVDGRLQNQTVPLRGEISANTNDLVMGMNKSSPTPHEKGNSFGGALDEVMIFNHAISGDEVAAVIASLKPRFSKNEVQRRLIELKELLDRGLILQDFYDRKVKECQTDQ